MFEIKLQPKSSYAEEGQVNPIRWMILSKTGENTFQQESAWIKCKDFFNDLAYTIQTGKHFTIYGFNAGAMNPPKPGEPVYMLLSGLCSGFRDNLKVVNQWLKESNTPEIVTHEHKDGQLIVVFDPFYFTNVYNISLISLLLRVVNCDTAYKTFDKIKKSPHLSGGDVSKWGTVVKKNVFFAIPEKMKKYVWYCTPDVNSENPGKEYSVSSLVHNNGVVSWSAFL